MIKNKLKILLLGSGGFVGKNILEQLRTKYRFYTPRSKTLDLANSQAVNNYFKKRQFDVVINLAVFGGSRKTADLSQVIDINLRFFFNLMHNRKSFKKLIHFGSGAEYGKQLPIKQAKESNFSQHIPADYYGFYKYVCSKYLENYQGNFVCLRPFGIYGKYEDHSIRFISNAICKSMFNLPITMNQNVYFDYLYINDLVKIVDYFITHQAKHKFYNVCTGKRISLQTIVKKIIKLNGKNLSIKIKKAGLNKEYSGNNTRLIKEIAGFKFTDFDQSLKELLDYYQSIKPLIKKTSLLFDN
ncbi:NAD-dependent epimerase/dehydratase family protein [Patescibacteria group bacterium]|nr:NAD-dependent epimerase/dehydratase family protein [Patescibacteria group bacterium]MBU1931916.1 NAD-dependent epimerase/dehydratase family protein [Patescibacteria group bacterium]